ncbi:MAG: nitrite reductase small subunit NirD [Nocardioides sp.]|uniref:nitrite reductase small subunit NirD n=1 Tax=Nocardioides sp. TaxID=35761 RepID=UPI0039E5A191
MSRREGRGADAWQPVCKLAELEPERGVTALVHGQAIAIFKMADGVVYALGNHDPFAKASAMSKGIVGIRDEVPFVGSPTHRHGFDLRTGICLEDRHVSVPAYEVKVVNGTVYVGRRLTPAGPEPNLSRT